MYCGKKNYIRMNKGEFLYLHSNNCIHISPLNNENVICINDT
jgi:hypothetical protein